MTRGGLSFLDECDVGAQGPRRGYEGYVAKDEARPVPTSAE
jgi:hypothetical protein